MLVEVAVSVTVGTQVVVDRLIVPVGVDKPAVLVAVVDKLAVLVAVVDKLAVIVAVVDNLAVLVADRPSVFAVVDKLVVHVDTPVVIVLELGNSNGVIGRISFVSVVENALETHQKSIVQVLPFD